MQSNQNDVRRLSLDESKKALRAELRARFPRVRFSVKGSRGTAYGNVHVAWTDGPSEADVDAALGYFAGDGFDGMTDSQYFRRIPMLHKGETVHSGIALLLLSRSNSPESMEAARAELITAGYTGSMIDCAARMVANGFDVDDAARCHDLRRPSVLRLVR